MTGIVSGVSRSHPGVGDVCLRMGNGERSVLRNCNLSRPHSVVSRPVEEDNRDGASGGRVLDLPPVNFPKRREGNDVEKSKIEKNNFCLTAIHLSSEGNQFLGG